MHALFATYIIKMLPLYLAKWQTMTK